MDLMQDIIIFKDSLNSAIVGKSYYNLFEDIKRQNISQIKSKDSNQKFFSY